jgi:phospholipase/carboxylesterase
VNESAGETGTRWSRRAFLGVALSALQVQGSADHAPRNPRLTARPGRPFRRVATGQTRIGEGLARGGDLFVPASYREEEPAPLILALHGGGGDAGRWSALHTICGQQGIVLAAPDSRGRTWDRVHGSFGPDVAFIDAVLRFTFERCSIDPARIGLAGFSDGASYTLSLGPSNGDLFTHLMAWSPGFSNPEDPIVGQPRVFVSHGSEDGVLPVALSRSAIVPMFEMDGYDVTYREFVGRHELTAETIAQSFSWFLED